MNGPPFDPHYLESLDCLGEPLNGAATSAERRPQLKICTADRLAKESPPERRWLVSDMIAMGRVTLLYGNGGDGKSLLLLQLSIAVATGSDWIGKLPEPGGVLIFSCEDDIDEVHRRLAGIVAGRSDINADDLANLRIIDLAGEDAIIAFPKNRAGALKPLPCSQK